MKSLVLSAIISADYQAAFNHRHTGLHILFVICIKLTVKREKRQSQEAFFLVSLLFFFQNKVKE